MMWEHQDMRASPQHIVGYQPERYASHLILYGHRESKAWTALELLALLLVSVLQLRVEKANLRLSLWSHLNQIAQHVENEKFGGGWKVERTPEASSGAALDSHNAGASDRSIPPASRREHLIPGGQWPELLCFHTGSPFNGSAEARRQEYFDWAEAVVGGCRGVNKSLGDYFAACVAESKSRLVTQFSA